MVQSPCIKICELNAAGFCTGCGRTRVEVGGWMQMSDAQKRETVKRAAARIAESDSTARNAMPKTVPAGA